MIKVLITFAVCAVLVAGIIIYDKNFRNKQLIQEKQVEQYDK